MFLVRKHRVVLVRKHKGLFGVSLCSSGQEIRFQNCQHQGNLLFFIVYVCVLNLLGSIYPLGYNTLVSKPARSSNLMRKPTYSSAPVIKAEL